MKTNNSTLSTKFLDYFALIKDSLRRDFDSWAFETKVANNNLEVVGYLVNLNCKTIKPVAIKRDKAIERWNPQTGIPEADGCFPLSDQDFLMPSAIWDGLFIRTGGYQSSSENEVILDVDEFFEFWNDPREILPFLDYMTLNPDVFKKVVPFYAAVSEIDSFESPEFFKTLLSSLLRTNDVLDGYSLKESPILGTRDVLFQELSNELFAVISKRVTPFISIFDLLIDKEDRALFFEKLLPNLLDNRRFLATAKQTGYLDKLFTLPTLELLQGEIGDKLFDGVKKIKNLRIEELFLKGQREVIEKERADIIFDKLGLETLVVSIDSCFINSNLSGLERVPSITITLDEKDVRFPSSTVTNFSETTVSTFYNLLLLKRNFDNVSLSSDLNQTIEEFVNDLNLLVEL